MTSQYRDQIGRRGRAARKNQRDEKSLRNQENQEYKEDQNADSILAKSQDPLKCHTCRRDFPTKTQVRFHLRDHPTHRKRRSQRNSEGVADSNTQPEHVEAPVHLSEWRVRAGLSFADAIRGAVKTEEEDTTEEPANAVQKIVTSTGPEEITPPPTASATPTLIARTSRASLSSPSSGLSYGNIDTEFSWPVEDEDAVNNEEGTTEGNVNGVAKEDRRTIKDEEKESANVHSDGVAEESGDDVKNEEGQTDATSTADTQSSSETGATGSAGTYSWTNGSNFFHPPSWCRDHGIGRGPNGEGFYITYEVRRKLGLRYDDYDQRY